MGTSLGRCQKPGTERLARAMQPRHNRPDRNRQHVCNLFVGHFLHITKQENLSKGCRELVERLPHGVTIRLFYEDRLWRWIGRGNRLCRILLLKSDGGLEAASRS